VSNADWWAKQLGAQPQAPQQVPVAAPRPANNPMPPSQQPMTQFQQPQQQASRAQSASQTATCPECGGTNYMSVQKAAARCYDCGYPLSQSGSRYGSLTGAKVEGNVKSAIGNDTQSNWNPQGIIGRVD
jgi:ribosomal protein L37E